MKVIILGGFLGSGKTTVLVQLANYLLEKNHYSRLENKVVIVENEISSSGVDDKVMKSNHFTVENLLAGCICCTSAPQLKETLSMIEGKYQPAWVLIEATGLAYPDIILEIVEDTGLEAKILAVVDAKRWQRLNKAMPQFVEGQLKKADVVFINKMDLLDEERLALVEQSVREVNPQAHCYPVCAARNLPPRLWAEIL